MWRACGLTFLLLLVPLQPLSNVGGFFTHIWNVGQGQWVTMAFNATCLHVDMGGETAPWQEILKLCGDRHNVLVVTHFDRDHINHTIRFSRHVSSEKFCLLLHPLQTIPPKAKELEKIQPCSQKPAWVQWWHPGTQGKNSNARSLWVSLFSHTLIPGDASAGMENRVASRTPLHPFEHLVASHHGSRYSSSKLFLMNLINVKVASISARKQRYGHPHPETIDRFLNRGWEVLETEKKGSLKVRIPLRKIKFHQVQGW